MKTFFIPIESSIFRDFLDANKLTHIDTYPNMTGIEVRDEQSLFYIGMEYALYLEEHKPIDEREPEHNYPE